MRAEFSRVEAIKRKRQSGFTIVELIVVIAVIAILAAIVLLSFGGWRSSVATNSVKSDLEHAASTMESARSFNNGYPTVIPSTFNASANNTIVLTVPDPKTFCIDGTTSVSTSIKYYIDNLTQNNGATQGTCATRASLPVPGQLTDVAFTTGATEIDVTWTNASPNYANLFTIQCALDPAFITGILSAQIDDDPSANDGSVAGANSTTTYYCRVRAENDNGQGPWSNVSTGDTQAHGCADSGQYGTYPDCYDYDSLPAGTSIAGYWSTPPDGYLIEDGSAVSRTDYADLFAAIGTTNGVGNGATTFNLPDSRGRAAVNISASDTEFNTVGKKYGEKAHVITSNETPAHSHLQYVTANTGGGAVRNDWVSDGAATAYAQGTNTYSTGGNAASNIMQPSIVLQYAIKWRPSTGNNSTLAPGTTLQGYWSSTPSGYAAESGGAISRSTYSTLYSAIGITYGSGDGSSTFNLPNSQGKVGVERNPADAEFATLGQTYGEKTHLLTIAEMATHSHAQYVTANATGSAVRDDYTSDATGKSYSQGVNTGSSGGGQAFNVIQPSITKRSVIKTSVSTGADNDAGMIVGTSIEGWWASAPSGYLLEDGSAVSRSTYEDLFNLIGTTFGSGDGSSTFNLPDARGRVAVNVNPNDSQLATIGSTLGEKTHIMTISELAAHSHAQYVTKAASGGSAIRADYSKDAAGALYTQGASTGNAGLSNPYNVIQPSITKNFAIKY